MKKEIIFLGISIVQALFICSFTGILSIWMREERFDQAVRIGWPSIFFTAFDLKNGTLNYSGNMGNLALDLGVSFLIALVLVWIMRRLICYTIQSQDVL
jgi:uncharacterized membrane protein